MDINPVAAAAALLELVKQVFPDSALSIPNEGDKLVAKKLMELLHEVLTDFSCQEDIEVQEDPDSQPFSIVSSQGSVYDDTGCEINPDPVDHIPIERKAEILKLIDMHPNWSLTTIRAKGGKELKNMKYVKQWREQVKSGGTAFEKWNLIQEHTYKKFCEARAEHKSVKEDQIRLWAIQTSQSFNDPAFKFVASHTWVQEFKKKYRISSRKVTKLVSKRDLKSAEDILSRAKKFQIEIKELAPRYKKEIVLNSDQVGFSYELVSNRTLTHKGEKLVYGLSKSPKNLATHSYTVQYLISMAGTIVGDVFLCFQEQSGRLGKQVVDKLPPVTNVTFTCSTSGKLTTSLFEYYLDNVVKKNVREDFLYILDSWGGQTKISSYESRFGKEGSPSCNLKIIPKNCTSICQPLDTTFNRQLKYFARAIYSEAMLNYNEDLNPVDEITTRSNILRTHSLLHNQLSAPIFVPMIQFAWYSSGLNDEKPCFSSVKQACFTFESNESAMCTRCSERSRFLKCAICRVTLCFCCFYYDYHFHFDN